MQPGDLVRVVVFKDFLGKSQRIQGVMAVLVELIPDTDVCIIMAQGRQWTATQDQLELISEG